MVKVAEVKNFIWQTVNCTFDMIYNQILVKKDYSFLEWIFIILNSEVDFFFKYEIWIGSSYRYLPFSFIFIEAMTLMETSEFWHK